MVHLWPSYYSIYHIYNHIFIYFYVYIYSLLFTFPNKIWGWKLWHLYTQLYHNTWKNKWINECVHLNTDFLRNISGSKDSSSRLKRRRQYGWGKDLGAGKTQGEPIPCLTLLCAPISTISAQDRPSFSSYWMTPHLIFVIVTIFLWVPWDPASTHILIWSISFSSMVRSPTFVPPCLFNKPYDVTHHSSAHTLSKALLNAMHSSTLWLQFICFLLPWYHFFS